MNPDLWNGFPDWRNMPPPPPQTWYPPQMAFPPRQQAEFAHQPSQQPVATQPQDPAAAATGVDPDEAAISLIKEFTKEAVQTCFNELKDEISQHVNSRISDLEETLKSFIKDQVAAVEADMKISTMHQGAAGKAGGSKNLIDHKDNDADDHISIADSADDDNFGGLSDEEMRVFGKSLSTNVNTKLKDISSDEDSERADDPGSMKDKKKKTNRGRKPGSKNKESVKDLRAKLAKYEEESKKGAEETATRKSSRK